VIDLDTPLGQQLFDVSVRRRYRRYQRIAITMTSAGNRKPAKAEPDGGRRREREYNFARPSCPNPSTIAQRISATATKATRPRSHDPPNPTAIVESRSDP
jgi:hypothetical protein